ncbi:NAD(P)/FAD-dependent oxidoreductase [Komagataeibacter diospyri]|nr:FAD-binding oxidoreductase [Komagataeibacter diospyri]
MICPALPKSASVVIVGGGMQGLSCAINLALLGIRDIVVLDAGYWQGGASGRNGCLIRPGFGGHDWTRLFELSWREWTTLSQKLGHNVMFTERGYTMIAETGQSADMLRNASQLHRQYGITSEILTSRQISKLLPAINQEYVTAALHQPRGGMAPHHSVMKGYLHACGEKGIEVRYRTAITGFDMHDHSVRGVYVNDHLIRCDTVVIAAGPQSPELARYAQAEIDGYMMRIEAMALEPMRPLIGPALALIDSLAYFHQTARGEVVGGTEVPETPQTNLRADVPAMAAMARVYTRLFPQLADIRILRQWAGLLHISSDLAPLLGQHPRVRDLWFSAGWSYGFAGAPGAGLLMAKAIAKGQVDEILRPFALDRFEKGNPIQEAGVVMIKN